MAKPVVKAANLIAVGPQGSGKTSQCADDEGYPNADPTRVSADHDHFMVVVELFNSLFVGYPLPPAGCFRAFGCGDLVDRRNSAIRAGLIEEEAGWFGADNEAPFGFPPDAKLCSSRFATCVRMNCFACAGS
jgi:hypothetical protein